MADEAGADRRVVVGSRVKVRYESGRRSVVRIANGDRLTTIVDIDAGSPLAGALLGRKAGDQVSLELAPGAVISFVILRVE